MASGWRIGTTTLAFVAAVIHLWMASRIPLTSITGQYFALSGALFLLGTALVSFRGKGVVFNVGAVGVVALSAIDNGLLYYTRTFGLGFLFHRSFRPPAVNGTSFPPPAHVGIPWSTTWIPPGAVQFFVLQCAIIVVAIIAIVEAGSAKENTSPPATAAS